MTSTTAATTTTKWWTKVLAGPGGDLNASDSDEQYLVLPKLSDPRVVVDRQAPDAVKDAIDRMMSSRTGLSQVRALAGGASALMTRRKPSWVVDAAGERETLRQHLSRTLDTDLRISISVGPPRPNRKPVVRCYRDSGLFAVAKLGPDAHTAAMVRNEARWLDAMAAKPLSGVLTPPLLHYGDFGGSPLLIMGALDLESDLGIDFDEVPIELAREFSERYEEQLPLSASEWWHGLPTRMNDAKADSVQAQMRQIASNRNFDAVKVSGWHGDWSPWNMGRARNGKLCIWDWERAKVGVPAGFDILHLHFQYGKGLEHADGDLEAMGIPAQLHTLVKRLYLFELCARNAEAGVLDSDGHTKVIDALDTLAP